MHAQPAHAQSSSMVKVKVRAVCSPLIALRSLLLELLVECMVVWW
jgi:hypothetical protein